MNWLRIELTGPFSLLPYNNAYTCSKIECVDNKDDLMKSANYHGCMRTKNV